MDRRFSTLAGMTLILVGILASVFNMAVPAWGLSVWPWGAWRLWPLIVMIVGSPLVLSPFLVRGHRSLGGLFIPGMPLLTTGGILLFASVCNWWGVWEWLWPLEVLAVALGFLFAAVYTRVIWLLIPAIIIGANGLVLQFCALTGLWEAWAVLWTIEPLSAGLAFLVIGARKRLAGLFIAGLVLCGLAGVGLTGMGAILPGWWLISLLGPALLILVGSMLLIWSVARHSPAPRPVGGEAAEAIIKG